MHVDEPGGDDQAPGIDLLAAFLADARGDLGDAPLVHGNVRDAAQLA